ncbi:hypothetical protein HYX07_00100 [Candidatus Woesearchaeota archaeon]|nr:hypothetical protein [Candidatus Woesearchaeota archaeon]
MNDKKLVGILIFLLIIFLILNIIFLALKIVNEFFFWIVLIIIGLFAYKVLPKMKLKKR